MNLEEAKKSLIIDKFKLDVECQSQPDTFWKISEECSNAISIRDALKEEKDVVWAYEFIKQKQSGEKVTDSMAKSLADTTKEYITAISEYLKAKEEADKWIAMKEAWQSRATMIRELCGLYVSGYFNEMSVKLDKTKLSTTEYENLRKKLRQEE